MDDKEYARFIAKVYHEPNCGCWLWGGAANNKGYGQMNIAKSPKLAHRLSYEHYRGPIPAGLSIDHLCRIPLCVNPDHLEPVTHKENMRRSTAGDWQKVKTHCPKGHAYEGYNLIVYKTGSRACRECMRYKNSTHGMPAERLDRERTRRREKARRQVAERRAAQSA